MKGKICDWKDDKGFGFIIPDGRSDKIFFHISDMKTKERRPKIADLVRFEIAQDSRQRLRAKNVAIEGLLSSRINYSNVEPLRKTIFDYLSIIALLFSIGIGGFIFYKTQDLNRLVPFFIFSIVAVTFLFRQKKPKENVFTCARCNIIANFDKRTIEAWNKGIDKIYCSACHQQWLSSQPQQVVQKKVAQSRENASGCLGVLAAFVILPILAFIGIYQWLS